MGNQDWKTQKPLNGRAYGSIPHLPESRLGPGDHAIHEGQARIACERVRDLHDRVIVTEKLDGSCTAVANVQGEIVALGRSGYLAQSSQYSQHQKFAAWVRDRAYIFRDVLCEGDRIVGEWLAQAHGTRYRLNGLHSTRSMWAPFDVFTGRSRRPHDEAQEMFEQLRLTPPTVLSDGSSIAIDKVMSILGPHGYHDAIDGPEGAVWRVERRGKFDFLAKYVRPDKVDGKYLPEISGEPAVWN